MGSEFFFANLVLGWGLGPPFDPSDICWNIEKLIYPWSLKLLVAFKIEIDGINSMPIFIAEVGKSSLCWVRSRLQTHLLSCSNRMDSTANGIF